VLLDGREHLLADVQEILVPITWYLVPQLITRYIGVVRMKVNSYDNIVINDGELRQPQRDL
jgi:hypothetical protein